jgi:hypothetical protein
VRILADTVRKRVATPLVFRLDRDSIYRGWPLIEKAALDAADAIASELRARIDRYGVPFLELQGRDEPEVRA